jgi:hypothetical protein
MKRMKSVQAVWLAVLLLLISGCGGAPGLGGSDQVLTLSQIDVNLQKALPLKRKASFGSVRIVGMALQPSTDGKTLEVPVKFIQTSYEIPEGIEGLVTYQAGLRYAPETRTLHLDDLKPLRLTFGNPSLEEYVSSSARKGVVSLVASAIKNLPLQTMPEGFRARKVEKFMVQKDQLMVDFD